MSKPIILENGNIYFDDRKDFSPNLTPEQILRLGSFGGTYFRDLKPEETIDNKEYIDIWKELPLEWIKDLDIKTQISSQKYIKKTNKYNIKCGSSLEDWNTSGWIKDIDPYGWFQWYCRFYQGRRCYDDDRQIKRFNNCSGVKGRWRNTLCKKISDKIINLDDNEEIINKLNDFTISPGNRQTLQHWGFILTKEDFVYYLNKN